jgi:hypothetical protein
VGGGLIGRLRRLSVSFPIRETVGFDQLRAHRGAVALIFRKQGILAILVGDQGLARRESGG